MAAPHLEKILCDPAIKMPCIVALALVLSLSPALAQGTGTVSGTIRNENGEPIPRVEVLLTGEEGRYEATTDDRGRFLIGDVLPGTYSLVASLRGYVPLDTTAEVTAGEDLPFVMELVGLSETITVTAERREASILDVPIAITALTGEDRDLFDVRDQQDLADVSPNMEFNASPNRITIRGVGRTMNDLGSDPGVGTYVDSTYTSETAAITTHPLFLERTEVLRGPQGTLFGRNTVGGLVNVITKRPDNDFNAEVRLMAGDYKRYNGAVTVTGPMSARGPRYRLNYNYAGQSEGYIKNIGPSGEVGTSRWSGGDLHLEHDFSNSFSVWFKYSTGLWKAAPDDSLRRGEWFSSVQQEPFGLGPNAQWNLTGNPAATNEREIAIDFPNDNRTDDIQTFRGELLYTARGFDVKYLGLYSQYDWQWREDYDNTPRSSYIDPRFGEIDTYYELFIQEKKDWTTHELQFMSNTGGKMRWISGLYYYEENLFQPWDLRMPNVAGLENPNMIYWLTGVYPNVSYTTPGMPNPDRNLYTQHPELDGKQSAVYAQIDFQPASKWNVGIGGRYVKDDKTGYETNHTWAYCPLFTPAFGGYLVPSQIYTDWGPSGDIGVGERTLEGSWDRPTWRVSVNYQASLASMVYGSVSTGHKSGGFRLGGLNSSAELDPEKVLAYELGTKLLLLDNHSLQLALAGFWNDYTGQQIWVNRLVEGAQPGVEVVITEAFNIPESETGGFELEATWRPRAGAMLGLSYGYLHTEILSGLVFQDVGDPYERFYDVTGNTLQRSPEHQVAVLGAYTFDVGAGYFTLSGDWSWTDTQHNSPFENPWHTLSSYSRAGARLKYGFPGDRFALVLQVRNLTDAYYLDTKSVSDLITGAVPIENPWPPRTVSLEVQARF